MKFSQKLAVVVKGQNRADICRRAHLFPTAINDYVSRGTAPNALSANRLARVLGVSLDWLTNDDLGLPVIWTDPTKKLMEIASRLPDEKLDELARNAEEMISATAA